MRKLMFLAVLAMPVVASCPISIKCTYHNVYYVSKSETEWKNGREYGIYEHTYIDERGRNRVCRIRMECP